MLPTPRQPLRTMSKVRAPLREVPVDRLRDEAIRQHEHGVTWAGMCRRIGWYRNYGGTEADTSRLKRALGIAREQHSQQRSPRKCYFYMKSMSYEQALLMCKALDVDPVDIGL